MFVEILGLGHPRSGTGYTSKLCKLWGLEVGHEVIKKHGTVAWLLTKQTGPYMWMRTISKRPEYNHLVYNTRDPLTALPSVVYTENTNRDSFNFRKSFIVMNSNNPIENAIDSIVGFHNIIMDLKPNVVFKIETEQKKLFDYLSKHYDIKYIEHVEKENTRQHKSFEDMIQQYGIPSKDHIEKINKYCKDCGYNEIKFEV